MRDTPQTSLTPLLAQLSVSEDPTISTSAIALSSNDPDHYVYRSSCVQDQATLQPAANLHPSMSESLPTTSNTEEENILSFIPTGAARTWTTGDANVLTSPQVLPHRVSQIPYRNSAYDHWSAGSVWRANTSERAVRNEVAKNVPEHNYRSDRRGKTTVRGNSSSVREYNRRISACARRRDLHGALRTLGELDRAPKVTRNLFTYNAVINALVVCSQYSRADEFWKEMHDAGIEPNLVTFNTMMKSCFGGTEEDVQRAFRLLTDMEQRGIKADRVTLNSLINACVSAGRVSDAHGVYEEMRRLNIEPDAYTFCTLAKQARHQCDVSMLDALLLHQLHHHTALLRRTEIVRSNENKSDGDLSMQISPVAYNTIADAYIRCGYPARAIELLVRLRDVKASHLLPPSSSVTARNVIPVAPDVQTFNVRLKALRESGAPAQDAFRALEEMRSLGLEADHITFLTLADLCCRRGEMALAEGILRAATEADKAEYERGSAEWKALCLGDHTDPRGPDGIRGRGAGQSVNGKRVQTAHSTYKGHSNGSRRNANQPKNAKANAALFNALIRGYSSLDPPSVQAAVALYMEMRRFVTNYGFSWYAADSVTYTMLVDAFARIGDAHGAELIIREMEAAGRSNVVAYNAYLKANRGHGFKAALSVLERMKTIGLRPDVVTYNTIIDFLSSEDNGTKIAEELVRIDMPRNGVRPDLLTFNTIIKGVARNRGNKSDAGTALVSAYRWLRELESRGLKPDEFTYQSMVSACAAAGDAPRALEFFRKVEAERAKRAKSNVRGAYHSYASRSNKFPNGTQQNFTTVDSASGRFEGRPRFPHAQRITTEENRPVDSEAPQISSEGSANDWMLLPHPAAYVALMRAFLSSTAKDGVDSVLILRDEMIARGLELGRTGYTAVADAYAARADINSVDATLREMLEKDVSTTNRRLSAVHHSIRMKALCNAGRLDEAIAILPEVEDADTAVFNVLVHACAKNKDMTRMVRVLKSMEACNVEPDAITNRALNGVMKTLAVHLKSFDDRFRRSLTSFVKSGTGARGPQRQNAKSQSTLTKTIPDHHNSRSVDIGRLDDVVKKDSGIGH